MKKIEKTSDLNRIIKKVGANASVALAHQEFRKFYLVAVDNLDEIVSEEGDADESLHLKIEQFMQPIISTSDFFYIMGLHGSNKRGFTQYLLTHLLSDRECYRYAWTALRDSISRYGFHPNKREFYKLLRIDFEQVNLRYAQSFLEYGNTVLINDCGHTIRERARLINYIPILQQKICTGFVLIRDYERMIRNNEEHRSYLEATRTFQDYYNETDMNIPLFQEGFSHIVVINDTSPSSINYISNEQIKEMVENEYKGFYLEVEEIDLRRKSNVE